MSVHFNHAPPEIITERTDSRRNYDDNVHYVETCPGDYVPAYTIINTPTRKLQVMLL